MLLIPLQIFTAQCENNTFRKESQFCHCSAKPDAYVSAYEVLHRGFSI